jgi:Fe-S oxidoreductase/nitrate reductase gamma subunit
LDSFARPIMWNIPHAAEVAFYLLIPLVIIAFLAALAWRARRWFLGAPEPGTESVRQRLRRLGDLPRLVELVKTALFQWRLSSDSFALVMHQAIFWGMAVLFLGTALATVDQDFAYLIFGTQILRGDFYRFFELALDLFGVLLIAGVGMAAYRRYLVRPRRLEAARTGVSRWDKFPFLTMLALIAATGFVAEGFRIAEGFRLEIAIRAADAQGAEGRSRAFEDLGLQERFPGDEARQEAELRRIAQGGPFFPAAAWAPVGYGLGTVLAPLPLETIRGLHQAVWWVHGLLAFGLILAIPFTKAFHLISSPLNLLLRDVAPAGRLTVVAESGVQTVKDLTWRQLLQIEACTWCGKCQEMCPGYNAGLPLSPRNLVQALDSRLVRTPLTPNGNLPSLHGTLIGADELWACCTCRACEEICPVGVQQPRLIIDLRRHLVDQGQVDEGLQDTLMHFQRYGNSFGQSPRKRPDWTKPLEFKLKDARKEDVEYLWFVGDYASYDQRAQEVTRAIARVFHRAGLDVGLLVEKEQNAGNDVRRVGEEGLFGMLREKNLKELAAARFERIVTTDPHTYNTLKNEYAADGQVDGNGQAAWAGRPVIHYTELLDDLIRRGTIQLPHRQRVTATYHDPCYLGRYNGVYEAPRRVLAALGAKLVEMPRSRANSYCCGAGGGRIWMKDAPGVEERPAESRVREALALPGVQCLVVACPKDLVMFQDAVKTVGAEDRLRVVDLGELVLEAMGVMAEAAAHVGEKP